MKQIRQIFIALLIISATNSYSQKLQDNFTNSIFTYIFKLDSTSAAEIYSNRSLLDSLKYFTHLTDSFRFDKSFDYNSLKPGHYLFLSGQGNNIKYEVYEKAVFTLRALGVNRQIYVFAYNLKGEVIRDARLKLIKGGTIIHFREDCGCYPIPLLTKKLQSPPIDFLVLRKDEFTYGSFTYNTSDLSVKKVRHKRDRSQDYSAYSIPILPGYLVLNQPKFKLLDTLKWKAFLCKQNGKPYRKPIRLNVRNDNTNFVLRNDIIKPSSPGAYTGELFIADTLTLDNQYSINLLSKRGRLLKVETFRLENYDLKKSFFDASINNNYFYKGENVRFTVSAFDANKLPLLDAGIKVVVSLIQVIDCFQDSLFVPFSWSEKYWEYKAVTDPGGVTVINFPDSLLFNAKMQFNATVTISTPEGENKVFNLGFTYDPEENRYQFRQEKDSIVAVFLYNSQIVKKKAVIKAFNSVLLYEKEVTLPYHFKVEDFPVNYTLDVEKFQVANLYLDDNLANSIGFDGLRSYDSIRIKMINPLGITVNYKIFYGNEFFEGGSGSKLDFIKREPSDESFHIIYSYRWKGIEYVKEQSFHTLEKNLDVDIDQPEVIYPGQKVAVNVHVTDYKNRNANKVNLTAYAVNSQLGAINTPVMPYFGKLKNGILRSFQTFNSRAYITNNKVVNPFYLKMRLFAESPYYQLVYNTSGLGKIYEDIQDSTAEFSPYVVRGQENMTIFAIYINKKLIYIANTNLRNPYSFKVDAGVCDVQIRTVNTMFTIKNVEFRKGKKLFLCLRYDSISSNPDVSYVSLQPPFLKEEQSSISKHLLYFSQGFLRKANDFYLVQGNQVYSGTNYMNYTPYYEIGNYNVAGPFEQGIIELVRPGKDTLEFYFIPGSVYIFYDDSVVVKEIPQQFAKFPSAMASLAMNTNMILNERSFPWPVIIKKPEAPVQASTQPKKVRNHPALHDFGNTWNERPWSNLFLKNIAGKSIKWIWCFNKEDDKNSRICFNPCLSVYTLKPGNYDIVIVTNNDSVCIYKNYCIKPDGTNYKFINTSDFGNYDSLVIANMEDRIVKLNRPVPRNFDNPPLSISEIKRTIKEESKETKVSGYVMDQNGNPIDMVTVFLENAGVFIEGAITNQLGYFEINAGKCYSGQLKIFYSGKYYNYYQLFLVAGRNTEVQINLPNSAGQPYGWLLNTANVNVTSDNNYSNYTSSVSGASNIQMASPIYASYEVSTVSGIVSGISISSFKSRLAGLSLSSKSEVDNTLINNNSLPEKNKFSEFLDKIKGDTNANRIRSKFRDYAYFIPNLMTDKKGEAHFTVVFPDNQTLWKTMVPAMDYHKRSGLGLAEVKAYKPLNTTLALPKFFLENDSLKIIGKVYNYTDREIPLTSAFKIDGTIKFSQFQNVKTFLTDQMYLHFDSIGKYNVVYSFETQDKYIDGEKRELPVLIDGIEVAKGQNFLAEKDTSFVIKKDTGITRTILSLTNNQLDLIIRQIDKLKNYNYGCNEQNASKLKALLTERTVFPVLGKEFTDDKLIISIIHKLEKAQRKDGSWGWWSNTNSPEFWMTNYIIEALDMAVKAGFHTRAHIRGAEFLKENLNNFEQTEKLYALEILAGFYNNIDYKKQIEPFEKRNLSLQDQFRLIRLKQITKIPYSLNPLLSAMVTNTSGNYWGEEVLDFKTNIIPTSALAYEVLRNDSLDHKEILFRIRKYFLTHTEMARNTIEQAVMLQSIVNDIIIENKQRQEINPELKVNGKSCEIKSFPYILKIDESTTTSIEKKGAPLYFSILQYGIETHPKIVDSLFRITAVLEQNAKPTLVLQKSTAVNYKVKIIASRSTEYVMIEVPIPSSCYYLDKTIGLMPYEVNREYFNDKVVIFCRNLPKGEHNLVVSLQPLFEGRSSLLPIKASLMYYPDHYGISSKKEVWVKE